MGMPIGQLAVRRSILVMAPPERVWQEFTTFESIRKWFGTGHRLLQYEPKVGGEVLLEVDIEGTPRRFGGRIVILEANHEVSWEDDWIPNQGWAEPTFITLRLASALGGTLVELFHHGLERVGGDVAEQHAGYERGWTSRQLDALKQIAEG